MTPTRLLLVRHGATQLTAEDRFAGAVGVELSDEGRWQAQQLARQVTALVHELRGVELYKVPGVSETLDWVAALAALDRQVLDITAIEDTLGVVLKAKEDIETIRGDRLAGLLQRALNR